MGRAILALAAFLAFESLPTGATQSNGNFDPAFVPAAADYLYVDLNSSVNGTGRSGADPTNKLPTIIGDRRQLLFNSDNGVQTIPCRNDGVIVNGDNVQVSSYGSQRATISAYQIVDSGWTRVSTPFGSRSVSSPSLYTTHKSVPSLTL